MNQTARIISIYAADTSGVCSALYEYGGMTVIHDASGCNSTYTTHDEPRWYNKKSMMFISGLTEKDAVMGNDDKFIDDLIIAANELHPNFIALCASPLPAMIGTDLDAIAYAVESETNIPAFAVKTNGMQSYISGAGNAFLSLAKKFEGNKKSSNKTGKIKVNLLGVTPLDFPKKENIESLFAFINNSGFEMNSCVGVDTDLDSFKNIFNADVNLVLSSTGIPLANYLYEEFKIPFVKGVPYGKLFAEHVKDSVLKSYESKTIVDATYAYREAGGVAILGESILSASLSSALLTDKHINSTVIETVGEGDTDVLMNRDFSCEDEKELEDALRDYDTVIGDPLFKPICHDINFIELPHEAFSGRCYTKKAPNIINSSLDALINFK